jgi:Tfp pilus assembly protein PilX
MADDVILQWNFANWVTIILMVVLGFAVLGMIAQIVKQKRAAAA